MSLHITGHRFKSFEFNMYYNYHPKVIMTLENEESGNGLNFIPQTYGMDVPSACTIVVIGGKKYTNTL